MLFGVGGLTYAVLWVRYRPVVGFRVFACVCVTRLKLGILDYYPFLRYVWIYSGVTSARLSSPLRVEFFGVPAQALRGCACSDFF